MTKKFNGTCVICEENKAINNEIACLDCYQWMYKKGYSIALTPAYNLFHTGEYYQSYEMANLITNNAFAHVFGRWTEHAYEATADRRNQENAYGHAKNERNQETRA